MSTVIFMRLYLSCNEFILNMIVVTYAEMLEELRHICNMAKSSKLKLHINVAVATSSVKSLYDIVDSEHAYRANNGTL